MAAVGLGICVAVGTLGLLFAVGKLSVKVQKVYSLIYNALVWNPIIRYVL